MILVSTIWMRILILHIGEILSLIQLQEASSPWVLLMQDCPSKISRQRWDFFVDTLYLSWQQLVTSVCQNSVHLSIFIWKNKKCCWKWFLSGRWPVQVSCGLSSPADKFPAPGCVCNCSTRTPNHLLQWTTRNDKNIFAIFNLLQQQLPSNWLS